MTEDQIGEIITAFAVVFAFGIFAVIAPKKLNALQVSQVGQHSDRLNKKLKEGLSKSYMIPVTRFMGFVLIILSSMKIFLDF